MIKDMRTLVFRLKSGNDLKQSLERMVQNHAIRAGFVVTCVGSLQGVVVRMAGAQPNAQDIRTFDGSYEIVSLVGTVAESGTHLHVSFSDTDGVVRGGHLKEGTIVHTTAEVVLGYDEKLEFAREIDQETGFTELAVRPISEASHEQ